MVTIEGTAKRAGIAIAVGAKLDVRTGINGVSPALLQKGLDCLKRGVRPEDYPEAVVACENAAMALAVKIPGVITAGIAAETGQDIPGVEFETPCVIGLPNLLDSVSEGDILIVDGNKGVVHVDPDPPTLIHYQQIEQHLESHEKVFIASEHIPAKTQNGETVYVYGHARSEAELVKGLDQGADGLIVEVNGSQIDNGSYYSTVLQLAAGKPVAFVVEYASMELLRAAMLLSTPNEVTVLFSTQGFVEHIEDMRASLESVVQEALQWDLDAPVLKYGVFARKTEYERSELISDESSLVLDLRRTYYMGARRAELADRMQPWIGGRRVEDVVVLIGKHIDALGGVVQAGARAVAVSPETVGAAKYAIRSMGSDPPHPNPLPPGEREPE